MFFRDFFDYRRGDLFSRCFLLGAFIFEMCVPTVGAFVFDALARVVPPSFYARWGWWSCDNLG